MEADMAPQQLEQPPAPSAAAASPAKKQPSASPVASRGKLRVLGPGSQPHRPTGTKCPACGAAPLTEEEIQIVRKPGRRSTRDANDPRNRTENLVTKQFLLRHIVEAHMSLRDIGAYHGYTISTLSRRAKQENVLVGSRARSAAAADQGGAERSDADGPAPRAAQQGGTAAKPRRKPAAAGSKSKAAQSEGEGDAEDSAASEAEQQDWQPSKRQRRALAATKAASSSSLQAELLDSIALPLAGLPGAGLLPLPVADPHAAAAHYMAQAVAQQAQDEIFRHVMAQRVPLPPSLPAAAAPQQRDAHGRGAGAARQHSHHAAAGAYPHEADTDEDEVAELLGMLRHRSPAPGSAAPSPAKGVAAPARKEEGEQPAAVQQDRGAVAGSGAPVAAAASRQEPAPVAAAAAAAAAAEAQQPDVKAEEGCTAEGEGSQQPNAGASSDQPVQAVKAEAGSEQQQHAAQGAGMQAGSGEDKCAAAAAAAAAAAEEGDALDTALLPSTAPLDEGPMALGCSQASTQPSSPAATAAAAEEQAGPFAATAPAAGEQRAQQPAIGSEPAQPEQAGCKSPARAAPAALASGDLSPQMAAVKATAAQHSLQRAVESFQTADMGCSEAMLLPLRRLLRAGKGGATLQEVVERWPAFPLAKQQDLFTAAVVHATDGRWEQLEADLSLELGA